MVENGGEKSEDGSKILLCFGINGLKSGESKVTQLKLVFPPLYYR